MNVHFSIFLRIMDIYRHDLMFFGDIILRFIFSRHLNFYLSRRF